MKKLVIILCFVLLFCSCGKEVVLEENESLSFPKENEIEEETEPFEEKEPTAEEIIIEKTKSHFEFYNETIFSSEKVSAKDFIFNEDGTFSFDLIFIKEENEKTFKMEGYYSVDEEYAEDWGYRDAVICNFGNLNKFGKEYILYNLGEIMILDGSDFSVKNKFILPEKEGFDSWGVSIGYDMDHGFSAVVSFVPEKGKEGDTPNGRLVFFDKNGKITGEKETLFAFGMENVDPLETVFIGDEKFVYCNFLVSAVSGKVFWPEDWAYFEENGYAFTYTKLFTPFVENEREYFGDFVTLKNPEGEVKFIPFSDYLAFSYDDTGWPAGKISFSEEDGKVYLKDELYCYNAVFDFENKKYDIEYDYSEENFSRKFGTSADGKFSIFAASERILHSGENASFELVLKNNETGKAFPIRNVISPKEKTVQEIGFLSNGDFYYFNDDEIKIYSSETGKIIFDSAENFPGGNIGDDGFARAFFFFRRDPESHNIMVLYAEGDQRMLYGYGGNIIEHPDGQSHHEYEATYIIGYLDSEGNIIESIDSKIPVWMGKEYRPQGADMYFSENDEITITVEPGENNSGFSFTYYENERIFSKPKIK